MQVLEAIQHIKQTKISIAKLVYTFGDEYAEKEQRKHRIVPSKDNKRGF